MSPNLYSELQQNAIRLLRLLPKDDDADDLRCDLFEYDLQQSDECSHPYEALSYVWGNEETSESITVNGQNMNIKPNLHGALLRLRDRACSRILWIDALCIAQNDIKEKEQQIPLMAEIYAKARQVLVWLGDADDDSGRAFEAIRLAAGDPAELLSADNSVARLLERPWFQRIWILQEVAAARHVTLMCGISEIDGHAFCLGLEHRHGDFSKSVSQVTSLIRGAIFRPRGIRKRHGRLSLDICTLGELADLYRTQHAAILHDKVYALLGMCSDDLAAAGLEPDYSLPWRVLMKRLTKFILGDYVTVHIDTGNQILIIESKGCVLGVVTEVHASHARQSRPIVEVKVNTHPPIRCKSNDCVCWFLQSSVESIRKGDIVCLLQGATKPTIIRPCERHLTIIAIEVAYLKNGDISGSKLSQSSLFTRHFCLAWDWTEIRAPAQQHKLIRANNLQSRHTQFESEFHMDDAIQIWHFAQILGDSSYCLEEEAISPEADQKKRLEQGLTQIGEELRQKAEENRQMASDHFHKVVKRKHRHRSNCHHDQIPLLWAAENGETRLIGVLLRKDIDALNLPNYDGRTPISLAAGGGHEAIVMQLLEIGSIDANSQDHMGSTPLAWAVSEGHEVIVNLLLGVEVEPDLKDRAGRTPLYWAIETGDEAITKLLLDNPKVDLKGTDSWGPLWWAISRDRESVVKFLLDVGANPNTCGRDDEPPLHYAAANGNLAITKLLLDTGVVILDWQDNKGQTSLIKAVMNGHEAVVKHLLNNGFSPNLRDESRRTPLHWAVEMGNNAIIQLLLDTDKVDVNSRDKNWRTPLCWAAMDQQEVAVRLLIETGMADVNISDDAHLTAMSWAIFHGNTEILKRLLDTGSVDTNWKDESSHTLLSLAAMYGHTGVLTLLLESGNFDVNCQNSRGQVPLTLAIFRDYEEIVKLLLDTKVIDVNTKDEAGETPLSYAIHHEHEGIVKLLLENNNIDMNVEYRDGDTPLLLAITKGNQSIVKLLLDTNKCDVNWRNISGTTPLISAIMFGSGNEAIVELLLNTKRVDPDLQDNEGDTPLSWAVNLNYESIVKMLESYRIEHATQFERLNK